MDFVIVLQRIYKADACKAAHNNQKSPIARIMAVLSKIPLATISLIVINAAVFAIGFLTDSQSQIIRDYGFIPESLFNAGLTDFNNQSGDNGFLSSLLRMFTSMFIHANIAHIAFNLAALAYMGGFAEKAIGIPRYLSVYFLSGMFAAFFHGIIASYLLNNGQVLLVWASGAISGILGMSAALGNRQAYYWLIFQIVFAFLGSVSSIPIAFTAHVGGFIAGVILTKVLVMVGHTKNTIEKER